jgi:hypothetical protein
MLWIVQLEAWETRPDVNSYAIQMERTWKSV